MKITKRQLRRIIKEEKARLISEASREAKEGQILADLNMTVSAIEEIEKGMYGLVDPGAPGDTYGDDLASDLGLQVARLNDLYRALQRHFESMDPDNDGTPSDDFMDVKGFSKEMKRRSR